MSACSVAPDDRLDRNEFALLDAGIDGPHRQDLFVGSVNREM